jgi:hypothetical protein
MAQRLVYHWKHGWIPLDHYAALSKAHGRESGARLIEGRMHIGDTPKRADSLSVGDTFDHSGTRVTVLGPPQATLDRFGRSMVKYHAQRADTGATGPMIFGPDATVHVHGAGQSTGKSAHLENHLQANHSVANPVGKDARTMTPAEKIKAAEIMFGTGSKQHQAAKKKFGGKK